MSDLCSDNDSKNILFESSLFQFKDNFQIIQLDLINEKSALV